MTLQLTSLRNAFVLQDVAQGSHYNNLQATIHPFVCYFTESGKICHLSFVVISDCLHHDTVAVSLLEKKLISHLKKDSLPEYISQMGLNLNKNRKNFIKGNVSRYM